MLKGFKDFIMRGNVIELAVAVVIANAFTMIVTAFTNHIVNPLVAVVGGTNINGLGFQIIGSNPKTVIDIGAVISAAINFLLLAARGVLRDRRAVPDAAGAAQTGQEPGPAEPTDVELLIEIRDLLARGQQQR